MYRVFDPAAVDALINLPGCRATMQGGDYWLESRALVYNPVNIVLMAPAGLMLFVARHARGHYDTHICAHPDHRGRAAIRLAQSGLKCLFSLYEAKMAHAAAPVGRPRVAWLARQVGFNYTGRSPDGLEDTFTMEHADVSL